MKTCLFGVLIAAAFALGCGHGNAIGRGVGAGLNGAADGMNRCPYVSERISGQNKICAYNCFGSEKDVTIKSYQQCDQFTRP